MKMFNKDKENIQFKGQYKLPKSTTSTKGKKWIDLDYWFTVDQIKETKDIKIIEFPLKEHQIINQHGYCTIKFKDHSYFQSNIPASKLESFSYAVKNSNQESELVNFLRAL